MGFATEFLTPIQLLEPNPDKRIDITIDGHTIDSYFMAVTKRRIRKGMIIRILPADVFGNYLVKKEPEKDKEVA